MNMNTYDKNPYSPPNANVDVATAAEDRSGFSWFLYVLKNYAVFSGRAQRKQYWMFFLFNLLVGFLLGVVGAIVHIGTGLNNIYQLAILIPSIAVGVRRMHDTDHSGWWLLFPLVNLVFLVRDSQPGENRFGPNPKEGQSD